MKFLTQLKIGQRLGAAFAVVLAMLLGVAVLGLTSIDQANTTLKSVYEDNTLPLKDLSEVNALSMRNRVLVMDMLINPEPANIAKRDAEMRANEEALNTAWAAYTATNLSDTEKSLLQALAASRSLYMKEGLLAVSDALKAGNAEQANTLYDEKISPLASKVQASLDGLKQELVQQAKASFVASQQLRQTVAQITYTTTAVALLLGMLLAWLITRSITRPIGRAVEVAETVAAGDLTSVIDASGRDEVAQLLKALKTMNDSLAKTVGQVRAGADSIATGSNQIAIGNNDLSQRTEEQASNLEQTAASMEELTSTVRQNADTARQASQLAQSASEAAASGGQVVAQVVATIQDIADSSRKISEIIGVIDGIAFQTNILSLNAAVEAARAGEQGRGFAVVAGEVRNLAQRSADAAKQIKSLIGQSVDKVEAGTRLADSAGQGMGEIVAQVKRVNDLIAEISAASAEQTQGISQVGDAVAQLDQVTQQNAALVEESAAAADSLKEQAARLAQVVQAFRIDSAAAQPVAAAPRLPTPLASSAVKPSPFAAAKPFKKPAPMALKRPVLTSSALPRQAPSPSPKPVAASGDEGDWESF